MASGSSFLGPRPWRMLLVVAGVLVVAVGVAAYAELWWLALVLMACQLPVGLLALIVMQRSQWSQRSQVEAVGRKVDAVAVELGALPGKSEALQARLDAMAATQQSVADGLREVQMQVERVRALDTLLRSDEWATLPSHVGLLAQQKDIALLSTKVDSATQGLARRIATDSRRASHHTLSESQAVHQLMDRYRPLAPLPEVDGWALSPSGLVWLLDAVEQSRPEHVVECGSGTSTLWFAYALKQVGRGHVTALEHQPQFAEQTRRVLQRHGLDEWATVVDAPLADFDIDGKVYPWYDIDPVTLGRIDMLFIDGPPAATGEDARFPALPRLQGVLAPGATIVMDDTQRTDEQEIVRAWRHRYAQLEHIDSQGDFLQAFRWNQ